MVNNRRNFKVAERIQAIIAFELLKMSDPRFDMVTITNVIVSSDMKNAKVYYVLSGGKNRKQEVQNAFESAAGAIRSRVAHELNTRFTPILRFYYDDTLDVQEKVTKLMEGVAIEDEAEES